MVICPVQTEVHVTLCPATAKSEFVQFISLFDPTGGRVQVFAAQTLCVCGGMGMDMPPMVIEDWEVVSHKSPLAADGWAASSGSRPNNTKALAAIRIADRKGMAVSFFVSIWTGRFGIITDTGFQVVTRRDRQNPGSWSG